MGRLFFSGGDNRGVGRDGPQNGGAGGIRRMLCRAGGGFRHGCVGGREPFSADGMDKGNDLCRARVVRRQGNPRAARTAH